MKCSVNLLIFPLWIYNESRFSLRNFKIFHKTNSSGINSKKFKNQKSSTAEIDLFENAVRSQSLDWSTIKEEERPDRILTTILWVNPVQWFDGGPGYGKDYWRIAFESDGKKYQTSEENMGEKECWFADIFERDRSGGVQLSLERELLWEKRFYACIDRESNKQSTRYINLMKAYDRHQ